MDLSRYPINSLVRHPGRTFGLALLVALIAFSVFCGLSVTAALSRGMGSLEARLGADIIVAPKTAKSTHDLNEVMLEGVPGSFYMDKSVLDEVQATDGVEVASPQYYLATVKAGCCTMPIQVIGINPATDFTIGPWIDHSLGHDLGPGEVVVGCDISGAPGSTITFYGVDCTIVGKLDETGTTLDGCAFCDQATIKSLIEGSIVQGKSTLAGQDPDNVISCIQVKVKDGYRVEDVTGDINLHVRGAWATAATAMRSGVADGMDAVVRIIAILVASLAGLSVVILVVAFLVLAKQRVREFQILSMIGASARQLRRLAVTETLVVSAAGALVGSLLGLVLVVSFSGALEEALGLPYLMPDLAQLGLLGVLTCLGAILATTLASAFGTGSLIRADASQVLRGE